VLQYQTFMFSEGFPRMLAATAAGNPGGRGRPGPLERTADPNAPGAATACPRLAACRQIVMGVAMACMLVTAAVHARARRPVWIAVFGALTGLSALAALFLGVLLAG
jgi:hypothetical protein